MKPFRLIVPSLLLSFTAAFAQPLDMNLLNSLRPRSIGPAGTSGRVTAIDAVHAQPEVIYLGTASGGLWRSEGGGVDWTPLTDSLEAASIGAIAIDQRNPDVIWIGTGEGNPRNSQTSGAGVFRSLDRGRTWQYMGLKETRNIHRIIIHRDNPNVVYVGALGSAWGDSKDRGIFRTKDGGKTWEKILFVNDRTGAADFDADPSNPNKMLVNMWEYRRWPWFFKSGGPGSGLYMTLDGGDSWKKLTYKDGLPEGELGKIGLAIAKSNPNVVYALVESKKNALYRSDNGGFNWRKVQDKQVGDRPFYYFDIAVDPANENRIYDVFSNVTVSDDGGKSFQTLLGWDNIHGDHHFWWIHPDDPNLIINGNDGGAAISRDRGKTFRFIENLPVGQFYHVAVDNEVPYNVYGGMQDNGTWRGPSQVWRTGGIRNAYWEEIGFGDGFDVVVEQDNNRYGYLMWQGGSLQRVDFQTGAQEWVKPYHPDGVFLRFNWNAGIAQDPLSPNVIYYGSQFVHQSDDRGKSWKIISPDLTSNDPEKLKQKESGGLTYDVTGAENHCTIIAISPSPKQKGIIWAASDDGNVQVTRDGGKTWTNVSKNLTGLPPGSWIPQVHASRFEAGEAYVVANNYRRDDWTPYLYRTRDFGVTWTRVVKNNDVQGYCLSWVQDLEEPKLQFLGTEFGLYISMDEGKTWTRFRNGYPTVSTYDMTIHPREHDLVIATFGRAFWVLDDIRPLRELARKGIKNLENALDVYPAPDAWLAHYQQGSGTRFTGNAYYKGENRPYGAMITFSVKEILKKDAQEKPLGSDSLKVEIFDDAGNKVRTLRAPVVKGMNRFFWGLERDGVRFPGSPKPGKDAVPPGGRPVEAGSFKVKLTYGEHADSTVIAVKADPRMQIDQAGVRSFYNYWAEFERYVEALTLSVDNLNDAKTRIKSVEALVNDQAGEDAKKTFEAITKKCRGHIDTLLQMVMPGEEVQGIFSDPDMLSNRLFAASAYFNPAFDAPNPAFRGVSEAHKVVAEQVETELKAFVEKANSFLLTDWAAWEKTVQNLDLKIVKPIQPVKVE